MYLAQGKFSCIVIMSAQGEIFPPVAYLFIPPELHLSDSAVRQLLCEDYIFIHNDTVKRSMNCSLEIFFKVSFSVAFSVAVPNHWSSLPDNGNFGKSANTVMAFCRHLKT